MIPHDLHAQASMASQIKNIKKLYICRESGWRKGKAHASIAPRKRINIKLKNN